jgi:hypothetical protein
MMAARASHVRQLPHGRGSGGAAAGAGRGADSQSAASRLFSTQEARLGTSVETAGKSACATEAAHRQIRLAPMALRP